MNKPYGLVDQKILLLLNTSKVLRIYRICHELTLEIFFFKRVLKNVIKRAFGELDNVFQDEVL